MNSFSINQIVKGKVYGVFVIIGFRQIAGEWFVQAKIVNPKDHSQTGIGELAMSFDSIKAFN